MRRVCLGMIGGAMGLTVAARGGGGSKPPDAAVSESGNDTFNLRRGTDGRWLVDDS
jgi:hypothetical protein